MERRLGGRLLDKPKQIPFQDGGHNLCLTIEDLGAGWRSKLAANYQVNASLNCRSRGSEFDPGPVPYFVEIDSEIISMAILLPSTDSFKKGSC